MQSNNRTEQGHFVAALEDTPIAEVDNIDESEKARSTWNDAWDAMKRRPTFWISAVLIVIILIVAAFPTWFTSVSPRLDCYLSDSNGGPTEGFLLQALFIEHENVGNTKRLAAARKL